MTLHVIKAPQQVDVRADCDKSICDCSDGSGFLPSAAGGKQAVLKHTLPAELLPRNCGSGLPSHDTAWAQTPTADRCASWLAEIYA